jgi:hypothetical protein
LGKGKQRELVEASEVCAKKNVSFNERSETLAIETPLAVILRTGRALGWKGARIPVFHLLSQKNNLKLFVHIHLRSDQIILFHFEISRRS